MNGNLMSNRIYPARLEVTTQPETQTSALAAQKKFSDFTAGGLVTYGVPCVAVKEMKAMGAHMFKDADFGGLEVHADDLSDLEGSDSSDSDSD